jgi:formate dehydrogenase subunit gamma
MKIDAIPERPAPLTGLEAVAMAQRQLKKHHLAIILLHWFNAFIWLVELCTGIALVSSPEFRVAPAVAIELARGFFGTRSDLLRVHVGAGIAWICVFLVYASFGWRTYLRQEVLRNEVGLDGDDLQWLRIRVLGILGRSREPLPPQGVYNAGQKLFALMVYLLVPVVMLSGLVMSFRLFGPAAVGWAVVIHFAAVGAVVAGLLVHVYMGAVFPEEKPAFFSMITGNVNELFAHSHHFKWWREQKLKQQSWAQAHQGTPAATVETFEAAPEPTRPENA